MNNNLNGQNNPAECRDIFLSHRSADDDFAWKLAGDIEKNFYQERQLLSWVDEADIMPGQSVVRVVNSGLEMSRFIGIIMTPDYFASESGWTDAEWHAALSTDPDNRKGRIIPLLVKNCHYIPYLLRHLKIIDMRGNRYQKGLSELLKVLKEEPLPRPSVHRGQLISLSGLITRQTLYAERSVPEGDPDVTHENLHCNLIPIERLPQYIYTAPISNKLYKIRQDGTTKPPFKQEIKDEIVAAQIRNNVENPFIPAFRLFENKIVTFHDLEDTDDPLNTIIDTQQVQVEPASNWITDENDRRILISLLNMGISRRLAKLGLIGDKPGRFFFPPNNGGSNIIQWKPFKNKASRTVAEPKLDEDGNVSFWKHLAAYIQIIFLANDFFLQIKPTWVFTDDGLVVKRGPALTKLVNRWTNSERNINIMYHVRFWMYVLRGKHNPISIRIGSQFMELSNRPAFIELPYGISDDQKDLMQHLDDETAYIAQDEKDFMELAAEEMKLKEELLPDITQEEDEEILMERADIEE